MQLSAAIRLDAQDQRTRLRAPGRLGAIVQALRPVTQHGIIQAPSRNTNAIRGCAKHLLYLSLLLAAQIVQHHQLAEGALPACTGDKRRLALDDTQSTCTGSAQPHDTLTSHTERCS